MKKDKQLLKMVRQLIVRSFSDGRTIERETSKAIRILKSLPSSQTIFAMSEFLNGLKRKEREHTMYIETATPLTSSQVNKMKRIAEKKSLPANRQVKISKVLVSINKEILGGFKMKVGDEIWDGSVLGSINQVKEVIHG